MRPLKLTMQAFGPYADIETIDFTQLGNRTMFVISGKTGAGKTTIFDAISYAIYGKASGEDRNGPELRSQFARADLVTEVSLDFAIRNKVYSITRLPQQPKKKEKGEGYTTLPAKAELYSWDENGEKKLLATKINDVEEKIKEIMLIDSNQFRQILMIPQGEFRKLLTSDSKDKEVILQRLFHTQIYKMVEEKLKSESTELKNSVEMQVQTRNENLRRIQAVTNDELRGYLEADSVNDIILMPLLQEEINDMEKLLEKLAVSLKEKEQEQDILKGKLFEAESILQQIQTREALKEEKSKLESQADTFVEKEKQVQLAHKAALLAQQEELCHRLKRELDQLKGNVTSIQSEIEKLEVLSKQYEQQYQAEYEREGERQKALEMINQLLNMKDDVYSFAALVKESAAVEASLEAAKKKQVESENNLQGLEDKVKKLLDKKAEIEKGQLKFIENERQLEKMQTELERMEKYESFLGRHQHALKDLKVKAGKYENLSARYLDAKALVEELENKWLHGQASLLAARLSNGEACPVCGSEHHPAPASADEALIPNEEDLKAAKQHAVLLEKEKAAAESLFFESQSIEKTQRENCEELLKEIRSNRVDFNETDLHAIKSEILVAKNNLQNAQKVLNEQFKMLDQINKHIEKSDSEKSGLKSAIQQLSVHVTEMTVQFTEKNTNLTRMMKVIPENLRTQAAYEEALKTSKNRHEMLVKRLEEAQKQLQAVKEKQSAETARLQDAVKHHSSKENELKAEREIFVTKLAEQGFENYSLYHSSKKTEKEIQILEGEIRSYREELRSVSDRLTELTVLLQDVKTPNVEGLKALLEKLALEIVELNNQRTDLFVKRRDNLDIFHKVKKINEEMKVLEERYQLIGHLHEIAKGQNTYRITFERYVLAAFLDDILREANVRLRKMTAGRFELLRKTDRSKGNVQSGLELLVFDQYTGQERHVKTLSGGESFKASLSLALGLADVVQNYAGGVSLETMFIDEGFGTLDPESLDQAIEALMDIQSSGRLVGIISHVPELKERIDIRLEVIAGQSGSRTEFVFTN
ncbi:SMC family ATPase [Neobacillus niacini]|uniref:AAA family ATPase n=1 Tax=Neobacillus niacini TaxID=86668 RepID=UPI00052F60E2|nr:SMC family ATPase [Neobacillus niacini]KGM45951.1 ATP-dependent dsDNA exonuclease [Neobacillus niacini]MEC1521236.1 SMC family ATPase [Neobacillus niacini]